MHKILLVEDSEDFRIIVGRALSHLELFVAGTVKEARSLVRAHRFSLILLDLTLPDEDGYALFSELQGQAELAEIPVICLTGRTQVTDKVTAFSLGAQDYVVKPFDPIELRARVDARLARLGRESQKSERLRIGELQIELFSHRAFLVSEKGSKELNLTQTEFKLLCCLARSKDRVMTRDQLLVAAWGEQASVLDRVVDVHICSMRKKLKGFTGTIEAVQGVGYRLSVTSAPGTKKAA